MAAREPNVIVFAIGINDSQFVISENKNRVSVEKFQNNLEKMVGTAQENGCKVVLVGLTRVDESRTLPIPWNTDKKYQNEYIDQYDAKIRAVADKKDLEYIDMSGVLQPEDLEDGLHPNTNGHKKMFGAVKEKIESVL